MKAKIEAMLAGEQRIIDRQLREITCDQPLVRAELLRELLAIMANNKNQL